MKYVLVVCLPHTNATSSNHMSSSVGNMTFRYSASLTPGRFATTLDDSLPASFAMDGSPPGRLSPGRFALLDVLIPGRFATPLSVRHRTTKKFLRYRKLQTFRQRAKRPGR